MNNSYKKSNFGAAFFFLTKEQREALGIVYSFCRLADDIVDDTPTTAPEQLKDLREETELIFKGKPKTELGRDLRKILHRFPIPKEYFLSLIDGVERDLKTPVRIKNQEELNWYMYRVASIVGLMCIEIFGYKNPITKEYAVTLGYAVQLTNILRDVYEDSKINRIYLPLEDLRSFHITEEDFLALKQTENMRKLFAFEIDKAQKLYDKARQILPKEDFKSLLAARAMGAIYEEILLKIKQNACLPKENKVKLSKLNKLFILLKTWRAVK